MKIVQVITHMDTVGGAQIHVRDLLITLKKSGHEVFLVTGGNENAHDALDEEKIQLIFSKHLVRNLNLLSDIKAFYEIRKTLKKIKPDILATHSSKAGVVGRLAGWSLGIPSIFTAHGWSFTEGVSKRKKWLYIFFEKMVGLISDGVIAVSEYDRELALKHKVLTENKIVTIHNGVHEIDYIDKEISYHNQPKMIMVARFAHPKRQLQLIKALYELRHIQWEISFAGEGPLLNEARDFVTKVGLENRIFFLGNRTDVAELLLNSNMLVLLSDWEGLPLSVLEAMRCGLPIIASDVGGVKEAVRQGENGYLISKNDFSDLQNKLTLLLTDPTLCNKMGENGRKYFLENFTFERMYENTLDFYQVQIALRNVTSVQTSSLGNP